MSEFKGTKGKWKFVHTNQHPTEKNEWHSVVQMPKIAISITSTKFLSKEESQANAQLIAHAPELLEMLEECYEFTKKVQAPATASLFLGNAIKQLIQKATTI